MLFGSFVFSITLWTGHGDLGDPTMSFIAVTAVLVYVFGFAIGLGAVSWVGMYRLFVSCSSSSFFLFNEISIFSITSCYITNSHDGVNAY